MRAPQHLRLAFFSGLPSLPLLSFRASPLFCVRALPPSSKPAHAPEKHQSALGEHACFHPQNERRRRDDVRLLLLWRFRRRRRRSPVDGILFVPAQAAALRRGPAPLRHVVVHVARVDREPAVRARVGGLEAQPGGRGGSGEFFVLFFSSANQCSLFLRACLLSFSLLLPPSSAPRLHSIAAH